MYICIHTHIYMYVYIYIYKLGSSRKPSGRFLMVSVVDIIQRLLMVSVVGFLMVSVVAGNVFYGFRRWFLFMVSVLAGKHFLWCPSPDFRWFLPSQEDS